MAKLSVYFLALVLMCQSITVFSQQGATTTTTASPDFQRCVAQCPALPQYNPVCGTNMVSYHNRGRLDCARGCGLNVDVLHIGTCGPSAGGK